MRDNIDSRTKAAGIVLAVVVALVLLQMTSLAVLPASTNDFLRGFAVGLAIAFGMAWFAGRAGKTDT